MYCRVQEGPNTQGAKGEDTGMYKYKIQGARATLCFRVPLVTKIKSSCVCLMY